ncbi:hypothetical protein EMPS_04750 [Entomortierella parvispora]|uniref:FAD-binding FR-type domain-containing protein n=1 Tax=Entomortierella parvispora TaxID=205924 RepID=A0A9P3H9S6_9FUNG|nr:hypothetical protein EMPS_04750 [Entomortierella parvispora]
MADRLKSDIAFTDKTRGNRNLCGVFALCGLVVLGVFALPKVRRAFYPVYLYVHRCAAFIFLTGLMMHYPSVMLWYYILPSFILFLLDRFVPRILQAWSLDPTATFTLNVDARIVRIQLSSREPMKPYLPGDFIRIMVPGLGNIYHPFTIASYWPEDPYKMTLFVRVFGNSRLCWTNALAKVCNGNEGPKDRKVANLRVHVDGPYGGRRHDYLKADTVIIFIAGTAITTFMALIKAIAAQIAASPGPSRMQLYLICTFHTCSELHAYGSFLHQITHDPRFTNWLHAEIFITRPEKRETSQGAPTRAASNHTATCSHISADTAGSITTHLLLPTVEPEFSPHSEKKATGSTIYDGRPLPTFDSSSISAGLASNRQAKYDLAISFVLVVIPLSVFYGLRAVSWEGSSHWCRTTMDINSNRTVLICDWTYALIPGFAHLITFLVLGYSAIYFARRSHRRRMQRERRGADVEGNEAMTGAGRESTFGLDDGNWDEGDVPYTRGRMKISQVIQNFLDKGIGCSSSSAQRPVFSMETGETQEPKEGQLGTSGLVAVLAGGPEGFVNMIKCRVYKAAWSVEFYRVTWTM